MVRSGWRRAEGDDGKRKAPAGCDVWSGLSLFTNRTFVKVRLVSLQGAGHTLPALSSIPELMVLTCPPPAPSALRVRSLCT